MAWSTPRTWSVNEVLTAANMNTYVSDDLSWLGISRPHCQVRDASYTPSTGAWVNPSWDAITTNVGSMATTSTGYITVPNAGFYMIGASCVFGSDGTAGVRGLMLSSAASGGGTIYGQDNAPLHNANQSGCVFTTGAQLAAFAQVHTAVFVPSGFAGGVTNIRMWAIWETT